MRNLYDEEFWLSVDKAFKLINCQSGMGSVGYDFRTDEQRRKDEWYNETTTQYREPTTSPDEPSGKLND